MHTAAERTLFLFDEVLPVPIRRKGPSKRALRTRLWKAALAYYLGEIDYSDMLDVAEQLYMKEKEL